jgi:hypothetical protein
MNDDRTPQPPPPAEPAAEKKPRAAISRREFARRAAIASAVASWAPAAIAAGTQNATPTGGSAAAHTAPPAQPASPQPHPPAAQAAPAPPPQTPSAPASQAEIDARAQSILTQYGARLSDDQKSDIRRLCAAVQPSLDRLRAYHLENADGEALYLKPLVERKKKPSADTPSRKKP